MPYQTCPIIRLRNIFKSAEATLLIRNDFQYRQAINRMYIQMQSAGVVKRVEQVQMRGKLKKNYDSKREYKVHLEGVQFVQVRYIVIGFALIVPLAIFIALCENIHYRLKYFKQEMNSPRVPTELDEIYLNEIIDSLARE